MLPPEFSLLNVCSCARLHQRPNPTRLARSCQIAEDCPCAHGRVEACMTDTGRIYQQGHDHEIRADARVRPQFADGSGVWGQPLACARSAGAPTTADVPSGPPGRHPTASALRPSPQRTVPPPPLRPDAACRLQITRHLRLPLSHREGPAAPGGLPQPPSRTCRGDSGPALSRSCGGELWHHFTNVMNFCSMLLDMRVAVVGVCVSVTICVVMCT